MSRYIPSTALPGDPEWPDDLGPARWTEARKEAVLKRLDLGEVGLNEAISRWNLTLEEIEAWRSAHRVYGRRGLRLGDHRAAVPSPQGRLL